MYLTAGDLILAFYTADADDQGVYVANLYLAPKDGKGSNATVTIEKDCYKVNGDVAMNIYMGGGTLTSDSKVGVFHVCDGTVNYGTDLGASPETDLNITTLIQFNGTFNWYPDDSGDDAYIANARIFGGSFLANGSTNADRDKKLGNGTGKDFMMYAGSTVNLANGRGTIELATNSKFFNYGGTLRIDSGAEITLTYHTI